VGNENLIWDDDARML